MSYTIIIKEAVRFNAVFIARAIADTGLIPIIENKDNSYNVVILVSEKETAEKLAETIREAKFEPIIEERE